MVTLIDTTPRTQPSSLSEKARGILAENFSGCTGCPNVGDKNACPNAQFMTQKELDAAAILRAENQDGTCNKAGSSPSTATEHLDTIQDGQG